MAGEDRRKQILQVAMRLFSQRGFRGTTTKEIAQAAGVSEAMVFRHFANKENSTARSSTTRRAPTDCSALRHRARRARAAGRPRRLQGARARHDAPPRARHGILRLLTHSALEGHELAHMFWDRNVRGMYDFLGSYIRDRQREGAMRDVTRPSSCAASSAWSSTTRSTTCSGTRTGTARHLQRTRRRRVSRRYCSGASPSLTLIRRPRRAGAATAKRREAGRGARQKEEIVRQQCAAAFAGNGLRVTA
jgi:AcrR family transcriptional regulator